MNQGTKNALLSRFRPRLPVLVALLVGGMLGALVVATFGGGQPDPHEGHAMEAAKGAPASEHAGHEAQVWTCSMHPQIRQSEPGKCPICGMDLIPVAGDDATEGDGVTGLALSKRARALAELRTVVVKRQGGKAAEVRLLGRVEPDETHLKVVTAWTGGRIDRLHVNVTGERVRAGQVIATLYSPEIFSAHQDLLVAKQQVLRLAQSAQAVRDAAQAALQAARQRLRLLGVPDDQLSRMEGQTEPTRAVAIRTPFAGTVVERVATEGAYVSTGAPLYRLADLRTLWVQLDAYESDLALLSVGEAVRVHVEALPDEVFEGKVGFIEPTLDAARRTAKVRVEVRNPDRRLLPGMFAEAVVMAGTQGKGASPLVVPATAPLFTGRRAIVYVERNVDGRTLYEPRIVRLGPRLGRVYPVVAGLSQGERIVARGAFVLDADLQIRGGASMMTAPDDRQEGAWDTAVELPNAERRKLEPLVSAYLHVQRALADDDLKHAKQAAGDLEKQVAGVKLSRPQAAVTAWPNVAQALRGHARHLQHAVDLEAARHAFEGLSEAMATLLLRFGNPLDEPVHLAFCPMAMGSEGASWFQQGREIDNAYFGEAMRSCGEVRQELAPGAFLRPPESQGDEAPRAPHAVPAGGHRH